MATIDVAISWFVPVLDIVMMGATLDAYLLLEDQRVLTRQGERAPSGVSYSWNNERRFFLVPCLMDIKGDGAGVWDPT